MILLPVLAVSLVSVAVGAVGDKGAWHQQFGISIPNSVSAGSPLVAISRSDDQAEVFWLGAAGDVSSNWQNDYVDGGKWHQQFAIAIPKSVRAGSSLVAISRDPGHEEVFWLGANGDVSSNWRDDRVDNGAWHQQFGIALPNSVRAGSPLVALSRNPSQMEVFWLGANGDVSSNWQNYNVDNGKWHQQFGIAISNSVAADSSLVAISRNPGHEEVFWLGAAGDVSSNWRDDDLPPVITAVNPNFGPSDTMVTIGGRKLRGVTAVMFGGLSTGASVRDSSTITAWAPLGGSPGSTLPVTAIDNGDTVASTATFSYPIAQLNVTGPLPYDPQDIGDTAWYNGGGYSIDANPPQTLMFGNAAPVFHVGTFFFDDSVRYPESYSPPFSLGNQGKYWATLQMCSLTGTPSRTDEGGACTNWDGNTGIWLDFVPEQRLTLNSAGSGNTATGDIALPAGGAFDEANLARTFRLELALQQADTNSAAADAHRRAFQMSNPFTAVVAPTALIQLSVVPYTIVYQPPGNQSTVTFGTTSTYGTNFSLGNSSETTNKTTYDQSGSTKFSMSVAYTAGFAGGAGSNWDQSASTVLVTTNGSGSGGSSNLGFTATWSTPADSALIPGSGDTCGSPTDCSSSTLKHDPNIYAQEPFWQDTFVLLIHPQFAVWVVGGGSDRYVIYGAVPVTADITVAQLAACAAGQPLLGQDSCIVDYSDQSLKTATGQPIYYTGSAHSVTLSHSEATSLLTLDPFYVAGQNAPLAATRAIPMSSVSYGAKVGQLPRPYAQVLTNQTQTQSSNSNQVSHATSEVDVIGNDESNGVTIGTSGKTSNGGAVSASESLTVTNGEKTTLETGFKTSYSDSTAVSNQITTTAQVTLNDVDNTTLGGGGPLCKLCHDPLPTQPSVNIYLDRIFGSFMFQDPGAPVHFTPLTPSELGGKLLAVATLEEQSRQRFPDVPNDAPAKAAIGLLVRTHIMTGYPAGGFQPNGPLTRAQLATSLTTALKLPQGTSRNTFSDISPDQPYARAVLAAVKAGLMVVPSAATFGPNDPVSRQEMATSLTRAFKLTEATSTTFSDSPQIAPYAMTSVKAVVAAGYMSAYPDGTFRPTTLVTRAEAAQALFAAMKDRQDLQHTSALTGPEYN